ncbi:hypothetical protein EXM65_01700 [Clostridium botulinum]|uniref:Uncharacterized protein n=1 Tax=Clostridium botulinum TaxID=1491 RepID=A0A6M0SJN3_CLOBO|nr:hypothetical protein [Clostridium botulinum]
MSDENKYYKDENKYYKFESKYENNKFVYYFTYKKTNTIYTLDTHNPSLIPLNQEISIIYPKDEHILPSKPSVTNYWFQIENFVAFICINKDNYMAEIYQTSFIKD